MSKVRVILVISLLGLLLVSCREGKWPAEMQRKFLKECKENLDVENEIVAILGDRDELCQCVLGKAMEKLDSKEEFDAKAKEREKEFIYMFLSCVDLKDYMKKDPSR